MAGELASPSTSLSKPFLTSHEGRLLKCGVCPLKLYLLLFLFVFLVVLAQRDDHISDNAVFKARRLYQQDRIAILIA